MDKQTFSSWRGVIVITLVLAIMIALATLFVDINNDFGSVSDGALTPDPPPVEKPDSSHTFSYYSSLKKAINDINNGTTTSADANSDTAVVGVYENEGRQTVVLMRDTVETTVIDITKDLGLNLGGYCLNLGSGAYINITDAVNTVSVDGTLAGSAVKMVLTEAGTCESECLFNVNCKNFSVKGGEYIMSKTHSPKRNASFKIANTCANSIFDSCNIKFNAYGTGVWSNAAKLTITDCALLAEGSAPVLLLADSECVFTNSEFVSISSDNTATSILTKGTATLTQCNISTVGCSRYPASIKRASYGIQNEGFLCLTDCNISVTGYGNDFAFGIYTGGIDKLNTMNCDITNCNILVVTSGEGNACGIENSGCYNNTHTLKVANCDITVSSLGNGAADGIYNANSTIIPIDAEPETIHATKATASSEATRCDISNCDITVSSINNGAIGIYSNALLKTTNCDISVYASKSETGESDNGGGITVVSKNVAYGIINDGTLEASNCNIYADAPKHSFYEGETPNCSIGIANNEILTLNFCTVYGTHCGIRNYGTLYINGGIYSGTGHGGIYFANVDQTAYVENATIAAVPYDGQFKDVFYDELGHLRGAFYVGGGENFSNISVYLNNCVIENHDLSGTPSENCYAFILRGTSGEVNNSVYISNSTINGSQKIRIDNDTLKLYVGQNTNITADMTTRPGSVEITNEVYVKK